MNKLKNISSRFTQDSPSFLTFSLRLFTYSVSFGGTSAVVVVVVLAGAVLEGFMFCALPLRRRAKLSCCVQFANRTSKKRCDRGKWLNLNTKETTSSWISQNPRREYWCLCLVASKSKAWYVSWKKRQDKNRMPLVISALPWTTRRWLRRFSNSLCLKIKALRHVLFFFHLILLTVATEKHIYQLLEDASPRGYLFHTKWLAGYTGFNVWGQTEQWWRCV